MISIEKLPSFSMLSAQGEALTMHQEQENKNKVKYAPPPSAGRVWVSRPGQVQVKGKLEGEDGVRRGSGRR